MIDGTDPLFQRVAGDYMTNLIDAYGTDHYYGADGFFSSIHAPWLDGPHRMVGGPQRATGENRMTGESYLRPNIEPEVISTLNQQSEVISTLAVQQSGRALRAPSAWWAAHSKGAYDGMATTDPDAVWVSDRLQKHLGGLVVFFV
jgi:hypothetical protein